MYNYICNESNFRFDSKRNIHSLKQKNFNFTYLKKLDVIRDKSRYIYKKMQ